ncbi:MAG: inorganic phosphate transporter [Burkholderiales bacterium]|jgi:PiT family inorganic phosphate transporter|nr:inorganic phosphate transporter [Burkholderiales bacterium]MCE3269328.1 inorganic phosphate transporter [Burkholderiales bacterium]
MHIPIAVIVIIVIALFFEFINGFHDTANAVATSISSKSLEPHQAIFISAFFNLIGALCGTAVAVTIAKGFADPSLATNSVIFSALSAAIIWNLATWYFGIPSSSSHALIGGLVGAIMFNNSWHVINFATIANKVVLPMIISPILGFIMAMLIVILIHKGLKNNTQPRKTNNFIREIQVLSTAFLSFSHGTNDAQKTMGIITLTLFASNLIPTCSVPFWVIIACAICMALGTLFGGAKIIKTLSTRVAKLTPSSGFAAEISSAMLLFIGSRFGMPLSTTHAVAGSIMGAGNVSHFGVNWSIVKNILIAWVLTFPACAIVAGLCLQLAKFFL